MQPDDLRDTFRRDLAVFPAGEILRAYLDQAGSSREVSWTAKARRAWSKAEQDVHSDLMILAQAIDKVHEADGGNVPKGTGREELLGTFAKVVMDRYGALPRPAALRVAKRLRLVPPEDEITPSWDAFYDLLAAFDEVMSYTDAPGNTKHVPPEAERLLEVSEAARASRKAPPKGPTWASLKRRRERDVVLRPYHTRETFAEGEWIAHAKFGEGLVLESGDSIRVLFEDAARALTHAPPPRQPPVWMATPPKKASSPPIRGNVQVNRLPPDPRLSDEEDDLPPGGAPSPKPDGEDFGDGASDESE